MEKKFLYLIDGNTYEVIITYKFMKYIRYRYKDGKFYVSAPRFTSLKDIYKYLDIYGPKLLKKQIKTPAFTDEYIYIFGDKINLTYPGEIKFSNNESLSYNSKEELFEKLKKMFLKLLYERQSYYEKLMGITNPYKIRIKKVKTLFGSNSKMTHSITYSDILMHYSFEIIDSLIVHELSHHFIRNHSKKFYDIVLKYYPNYYLYNKKLKRGIFK